uniref:Integrase n=1 Tax=Haemonchus contortus TaxID=6289 RepID=A0A7I4Y6G0_HAECO
MNFRTNKQTNRQTNKQTNKQTDRQTDRQTEDRQTDASALYKVYSEGTRKWYSGATKSRPTSACKLPEDLATYETCKGPAKLAVAKAKLTEIDTLTRSSTVE